MSQNRAENGRDILTARANASTVIEKLGPRIGSWKSLHSTTASKAASSSIRAAA